MNKCILIILITLTSCSMIEKFQTPEKISFDEKLPPISNRDLWVSRDSDDLLLHPIFATLPLERRKTNKGTEVFSFQNNGGTTIDQTCNLSSYYHSYSKSVSENMKCEATRVEIKCSHVFYVNNNIVTDYKKVGQCYGDRFDFRPMASNGLPFMTPEELAYWDRLLAFDKKHKISCKVSKDCNPDYFCENNICKKSGILSKFIDF